MSIKEKSFTKTERSADDRYARRDWQTAEQHAIGLAIQKQHDAMRLRLCRLFETWRSCKTPQCRREGDCTGDMHACFLRFRSTMADDDRNWFRAFVTARSRGKDTQAAAEAADAHVARYDTLRGCAEAPAAPAAEPASSQEDTQPPQPETERAESRPRIRAL